MDNKEKFSFVKFILILIMLFAFGMVFGITAYLMHNKPIASLQPQISASPEAVATPIVKDEIADVSSKALATEDWKTYRNEKDTKENYKLVEIKIPSGWKANDNIFTTSLTVDSRDPDFKFSFNLDISNGNEIITAKDEKGNFFEDSLINILRRHEKEYKKINIGDIPAKGMQQEYIDNEGSGAFVINTYLYLEPYVYTFNFLEFASGTDKITSTAKILNNQILSTFKFIN